VHGTLQEYALARPAFVSFVPDGLDSKLAAPLMCAGHTLIGAVSKLDAHLPAAATTTAAGDKTVVVVLGAGGGLGHLGVQIARHRGYRVVAIDAGAEKEKLCLSLGAEHYIDITTTSDIASRVKNLTNDSEAAHAAIIVSGAEDAFSLAPRLVRNGGVLVVVGLPRNDFLFPVAPIEISSRGLSIVGASVGTEAQMDELLAMADKKIVVPRVEVIAFEEEEVAAAFQGLEDGDVVGRLVVRVS
jgi:propanol-preferring alcohol dehydrogenase